MGGRKFQYQSEDQRLWLDRMAAKGWTAPEWPAEYGGGGLSREQHKVLLEEMARIQARPPLNSFGIWMIGPAIQFGSEALKQQHIPPIVRGEIRWCQGTPSRAPVRPRGSADQGRGQGRSLYC